MSSGDAAAEGGRRGRGEEAVEGEDEAVALLLREERLERQRADRAERRLRRRADERLERGRLPLPPDLLDAAREEDELARGDRVGVAAEEAEEAAEEGGHQVAPLLALRAVGRRGERAEEVDLDSGRRAGGEDRDDARGGVGGDVGRA